MLAVAALALAGCETLGYYSQAAHGHLSLLAARQPISALLAEPSPGTRERLTRVLEIREFASRELALPDNGSYRSVVPTGEAVVWSVVETPSNSLQPQVWCFPVAGCTTYRGYFDRAEAEAFAQGLASQGLDVAVDPVPTYSTLGWFDDPLPSSALGWADPDLAALIFHELAHHRLYRPGDSAFNEAFATAVAEAGVQRWLGQGGDPALQAEWAAVQARKTAFIDLLLATRAQLIGLYAAGLPEPAMQAGKTRLVDELRSRYAALKASWNGADGFDRWMARPLNNARLAAVATYREQLPGFQQLLRCVGDDLPAFYRASERLAALDEAARRAVMADLAAGACPSLIGVHPQGV